jgi:hypothetical protein
MGLKNRLRVNLEQLVANLAPIIGESAARKSLKAGNLLMLGWVGLILVCLPFSVWLKLAGLRGRGFPLASVWLLESPPSYGRTLWRNKEPTPLGTTLVNKWVSASDRYVQAGGVRMFGGDVSTRRSKRPGHGDLAAPQLHELEALIGPTAARLARLWFAVFTVGWLLGLVGITLAPVAFSGPLVWLRVTAETITAVAVLVILIGFFLMRACSKQASQCVSDKVGYPVRLGMYSKSSQWRRAIRRERYFHEHGRPKRRIYQDWSAINRLCDEEDGLEQRHS